MFNATLASNANIGSFPNNTATKFINKLPAEKHLGRKYAVALRQISFSSPFPTLTDQDYIKVFIEEDNKITTTKLSEFIKYNFFTMFLGQELVYAFYNKYKVNALAFLVLKDKNEKELIAIRGYTASKENKLLFRSEVNDTNRHYFNDYADVYLRLLYRHWYVFKNIYYNQENDLFQEFQKVLAIYNIDCEKNISNFIKVKNIPKSITVLFFGQLSSILGFSTNVLKGADYNCERGIDLKRPIYSLFVHLNICEETVFGDGSYHLLKVVNTQHDISEQIIDLTIQKPHFVPLNTNYLNSLEITVTDEGGNLVKFPSHTMCVIQLQFKPI